MYLGYDDVVAQLNIIYYNRATLFLTFKSLVVGLLNSFLQVWRIKVFPALENSFIEFRVKNLLLTIFCQFYILAVNRKHRRKYLASVKQRIHFNIY